MSYVESICIRSFSPVVMALLGLSNQDFASENRAQLCGRRKGASARLLGRQHLLALRRANFGRRARSRVVVRVDAQVVQDCLGRFGGWNNGDDLHVATTLVALEDVDCEYAP